MVRNSPEIFYPRCECLRFHTTKTHKRHLGPAGKACFSLPPTVKTAVRPCAILPKGVADGRNKEARCGVQEERETR
jgi:hypothetical protein